MNERLPRRIPPLNGVRVIELGEFARVAGWLLAELGASVVQIKAAPCKQDPASYFDRGKRQLHLGTEPVQPDLVLDRAAASARVVLIALTDGVDGLGERLLRAALRHSPTTVVITATGYEQPHVPVTELVAWAASGVLHTMGDADGEPMVPGGNQAIVPVGLNTVIAVLADLCSDAASPAHLIDISVKDVLVGLGVEKGVPPFLDDGVVRGREGNHKPFPATGVYPAADGYVAINAYSAAQWAALANWAVECGGTDGFLMEELRGGPQNRHEMTDIIDHWLAEVTANHSMAFLTRTGQTAGVPITPVHSIAQFAHHPIFRLRGMLQREGSRVSLKSPLWRSGLTGHAESSDGDKPAT